MDRSTVLCVIFFAGLAAHAALVSASTTPAFAWSNAKFFSGREVVANTLVPSEDLSALAGSKNGALLKYINGGLTPEVIVLYLENELSTSQAQQLVNAGSFSSVQGLLSSSSSSLYVPTIWGQFSVDSFLQSLPSTSTTIFVSGALIATPGSKTMTLEQLLSKLSSGQTLFSRKDVTNVIVVPMDAETTEEFTRDDSVISRVEAALASIPHVGVLLSSRAAPVEPISSWSPELDEYERRHFQYSLGSSNSTNNNTNGTTNSTLSAGLFPDGVAAGLIISIPLLIILTVGLVCLCGLQSELKFDGEKVKKQ